MEKVYLSGPITGTEDYESRFNAEETRFKYAGYKVVNPVKQCAKLGTGKAHEEYMKYILPFLLECDCIYLMEGWEESEGCKLEKLVADGCGIPVVELKILKRNWE